MSNTSNTAWAENKECAQPGCREGALALSEFCWDHLPNKDSYKTKIVAHAKECGSLRACNLKKADLRDASLETIDMTFANLSQANLSGANLFDSKLDNADMVGTRLLNCELNHATLKNVDLTKADISGSRLWNADLTGANLAESRLSGTDFWNARLFNIRLWHADLKDAKAITARTFSSNFALFGTVAKINETGLLAAEESYRGLKGYFLSYGMYNDASWAAFKEKSMERLIFRKNCNPEYIPSLVMNALCGYGEKPYRIVASAVLTILIFAAVYALSGAIENSANPSYQPRWSDYLYYSTITFTTVGYGDFIPKSLGAFRLLAAAEAFLGVFLTGLFIFTLGRRYSGR